MKFSMLCFLLLFFLILGVKSQNVLSDILERINNNNDDVLIQDEPDDVNAIIEDTRLKMVRLMRRSPIKKAGVSDNEAAVDLPRRKDTPTNVDLKVPAVESWTGRWFPEAVTENPLNVEDKKTNLTVDWDMSAVNFTCYHPSKVFYPDPSVRGIIKRDYIPVEYSAAHICMSSSIEYYDTLPTFGPHRPVWPKYGEYMFVPRQRWLHSLEVTRSCCYVVSPMCTSVAGEETSGIVKNCLYRHIITPYNLLTHERPLALLTWGWAYLMPDVDTDSVVNFIQEHALNGPERLYTDGNYEQLLIEHAEIISTIDDKVLCPHLKG